VKSLCNIKSPMEVESFGVKMSDYGLDKPLITAKLDFGTKTKTIKIGNSTGEYHYLKIDGDIYLVTKEDLYMVMLEKMKYLNDSVLSLNPETVTEISYKSMKVVKNDNGWTLIEPFSFNADNDKVKEVLEKICEISAADIVKKEEVKDGERVWVSLVLGDDKVIGFCVAGDCILFEHAEYAFKVNMDELEFLNLTAFDLSQKYIAPIAINEITSLKFVSNEGVVDFTIEAPDSEASVFYKNGTEVSDVLFRDFYQKLMGLTFTKEGAIEGVVEYSITFTKTDGTVFAVQFLPYSETEYAIDINGLKRFLINKKSVTDIYEAAKSLQ
ncbi:MAG: DUF4340 domain-containing protein, partial [Clostridia bacterium]|nr:DUF4340 domain-containing protein [Clostridia bacterium]